MKQRIYIPRRRPYPLWNSRTTPEYPKEEYGDYCEDGEDVKDRVAVAAMGMEEVVFGKLKVKLTFDVKGLRWHDVKRGIDLDTCVVRYFVWWRRVNRGVEFDIGV